MYRHTRHTCHRSFLLLSLLLASFIGATAASDRVVVTSGRVVYDAFGRVIKTYHPTVDGDTVTAFSCELDTVPPTVTAYDVLDRPVRVTYPDNSVTETDYGVSGHVQVTTVTDALGNVSKTHVDGSGRTVKSTSKEPSLFSLYRNLLTQETSILCIRKIIKNSIRIKENNKLKF